MKVYFSAKYIATIFFWLLISNQLFAQLLTREQYEAQLKSHPYNNFNRLTPKDLKQIPKYLGPDLAWEQDYLRTMDPNTGMPEFNRLVPVLQMVNQQLSPVPGVPGAAITPWVERGPNNVGGRTRALMFDPNDATNKKVWAGGVTGGLWYNNDITSATTSWVAIDNFWDNIAVTCIAYDPNNTQIFYVGTGEVYTGASRGAGIWKSIDGGLTWNQLSATSNFYYINDLVVRNENGISVLYAAVDGRSYNGQFHGTANVGLQRSLNGGNSFTQVLPNIPGQVRNYTASDIEIAADNRLWVGTRASIFGLTDRGGGRILFSDNGINWSVSHSQAVTNGYGRVELACAPSNANVVYAMIENQNELEAMVKTTNKGSNWTTLLEPNDVDNGIPANDFTRGQAFYDLILAVAPTDENFCIAGGINIHRTANGGTSWVQISKWSNNANQNLYTDMALVHADQHQIIFRPGTTTEAIVGNDGGVYYSPDITNLVNVGPPGAFYPEFNTRNNNFNVTQFYAGAIHPTAGSNVFLAGSQDNGTQRFANPGVNATTEVEGGDGAFCFIDQTNPNIAIASYVYNNYYKSVNGGNFFPITLIDEDSTGSFINVADYDDIQNVLFTYKNDNALYRIRNIEATPTLPEVIVGNFNSRVTSIKVSPYTTNSSKVFVGTSSGRLFRINNANATYTVTEITPVNFPIASISSIEFGANENEILVTFFNYGISPNVIYTSNGTTWNSKEGNLPDMPVRWALINPVNPTEAILATEVGVWSTTNFNAISPNWSPSNSGLANVRVDMFQTRSSDNEVIAITHGRGLFSSNAFNNTTGLVISHSAVNPGCSSTGSIDLTVTGGTPPYSYFWSNSDTTEDINNLAAGNYKVIVSDSNLVVDSAIINLASNSSVVNFYPYSQSFETTNFDWTQSTDDQIDWIRDNNGTQTAGTGPTSGAQGNFYMYIESTVTGTPPPAQPGDEAILLSPCFDLTFNNQANFVFSYHMFNQGQNNNMQLSVEIDSGNGIWNQVWQKQGNQGNTWHADTLGLASYFGKTIQIRFIGKVATTGTIQQSDIAVDFLRIISLPLSFTSTQITQLNCFTNQPGAIDIEVIGGSAPYNYFWSNNANTQDLQNLQAGIYQLTVVDANNDSLFNSFEIFNPIVPKYTESFETNLGFWKQSSADNLDFTRNTGTTITNGTGPTAAISGSFYIYVKSSTPAVGGNVAILESNCIDLSNSPQPNLTFYYHQYSQQALENMNLSVEIDSGGAPVNVFSVTGNQGNQWNKQVIDLIDFKGKSIIVRFIATVSTTGNFFLSDIALDNIAINQFPPLIIDSVHAFSPNCNGPNSGYIIPFISGGVSPLVYNWSNNANTASINNLTAGNYKLVVTDSVGQKDSISVVLNTPPLSNNLPYTYDWETGLNTWTQEVLLDDFDWTIRSGSTPSHLSSLTGPAGAKTGINYIYTESSVPQATGDVAILNSGCFDFTSAKAPMFVFENHFYGNQDMEMLLQADSGNNVWNTLWSQTGNAGNFWNTDTILLPNFIGKNARFRFIGTVGSAQAFQSDMALDKITVLPGTALKFANVIATQPACQGINNGGLNLTISGGYKPYSFTWSTNAITEDIANVSAGNYSVTVTDLFGNFIDTTLTLFNVIEIEPNQTVQNPSCQGQANGLISVLPSGSFSPPYQFNWSTGAGNVSQLTALDTGIYSVTITDQIGCFTIFSDTLTAPDNINLNLFTQHVSCFGQNNGLAAVTVTGGTQPYQITWSNNFNTDTIAGLAAGQYGVLVTDSVNCQAADTFTVFQPQPLQVSLTGQDILCNGSNTGVIKLSTGGGTQPYQFLWNNNLQTDSIFGLQAGNYQVTITDLNQCDTVVSETINEPLAIQASFNTTPANCNGGTNGTVKVEVINGTQPFQYNWSISALNTDSISGLSLGNYFITITDSNNCQKIESFSISENSNIIAYFKSVTALSCFGDTNGAISAGAQGGIHPYNFQWSNNLSDSSITNLSAGIYFLSVSDSTGCTAIIDTTLTQPAPLNVSFNLPDSICLPSGTINLNPYPSGGFFTGLGITNNILDPLVLPMGNNNIKYVYTDTTGCSDSLEKIIYIGQPPIASFNFPATVCQNEPQILLTSGQPLGGVYTINGVINNHFNPDSFAINTNQKITYFISNLCGTDSSSAITQVLQSPVAFAGNDTSISTGNFAFLNGQASQVLGISTANWSPSGLVLNANNFSTQTVALTQSQKFTLQVSHTGNSCTASDSVQVFVINQPLQVSLSSLNDSVCMGDAVSLITNVSGGIGNYTYTWKNIGNIQGVSGNNQTAFPTQTTLFKVYVNDGNSIDSSTTLVYVFQPTNAGFNTLPTLCEGDTAQSLSGEFPAGGNFSGIGVVGNQFNPKLSGMGNFFISYSVIDSNGCLASATNQVVVNAKPQAALSVFGSVCQNNAPFTLTGGIPQGGVFYVNGAMSSSFNASSVGSGNHQIAYTYTNQNGCTDTAFSSIQVLTSPQVNAGVNQNIPINTSTNLTGNVSNSSGYAVQWQPASLVINPDTLFTQTQNLTQSQLFTLQVTDTTNGCQSSNQVLITVTGGSLAINPQAVNNQICFGDSTQLLANASGGSGNYTYSWIPATGLSNTSSANPIAKPTTTTVYQLVVSDGSQQIQSTVTVNVKPLPQVMFTTPVNACEMDTAFALTGGLPIGGIYSGIAINQGYFSPQLAGVGNHVLTYEFTGSNGCKNTAFTQIEVHANPVVNFSAIANLCDNDGLINLNATPQGGVFIGNGIVGNQFNTSLGSGNYTVAYQYTNVNGCTSVDTQMIVVNAAPNVNAGPNLIIPVNTNTTIFGSATGNQLIYQWQPSNLVVTPNNLTTGTATLTNTTNFSLTATDTSTGCSATDQVLVTTTGGPLSIQISADTQLVCLGDSVTLEAFASGGDSAYSFSWTPTFGLSQTSGATVKAAPNQTTTYTATVTSDTLTAFSQISITVMVLPTTSLLPIANSCVNQLPINLTGGSPGGGVYNGNGVVGSLFNPQQAGVGSHNIIYTFTDPNGCSSADTQLVQVFANPVVGLNFSVASFCESEPAFPLTEGTPVGGQYTGLGVINNQFNANTAGSGNHIINYTFVDGNGCQAIATDTIEVIEAPQVSLVNMVQPLCFGQNSGSIDISATTTNGNLFYNWGSFGNTQDLTNLIGGTYVVSVTDGIGCQTVDSFNLQQPQAITAQLINTGVSCFGKSDGQLNVLGQGGTGILQYAWNNGLSGSILDSLVFGIYEVTITDVNNCSFSLLDTVKQPLPLLSNINFTNLKCFQSNDGSIQIQPFGGTAPYQYNWNNGFVTNQLDSLTAGKYKVTITDFNGCTRTDSITLAQPSAVNVGIFNVGSLSFCTGGSVVLSANPTTGLGYQWYVNGSKIIGQNGPTYTATVPGNYYVEGTNLNGCKGNSPTLQVTVGNPPVINLDSIPDNFCINVDTATLVGLPIGGNFSGPGVGFNSFFPSVVGLGVYNIIYNYIAPNGCSASKSKTVYVRDVPIVGALSGPLYVQPNQMYSYIINPNIGSTYKWTATGGNVTSTVNNLASVLWGNAGIGSLNIEETSTYGCKAYSNHRIIIGSQVGINEETSTFKGKIYPNPVDDKLTIELTNASYLNYQIHIYSPDGKLVFEKITSLNQLSNTINLDLDFLSSGFYILSVFEQNESFVMPLLLR